MSKYISLTKEQREEARNTDLAEFLKEQGETITIESGDYVWRAGAEKITLKNNLWYNHYEQKGGDAVDFASQFYNLSYPEAVMFLLNGDRKPATNSSTVVKREKQPFKLPYHNRTMTRMLKYLLQDRGLDKDVVYAFIANGMIYESEKYHNVVFVGKDKDNIPRHAHTRATSTEKPFKHTISSSNPKYSFHWTNPQSDKLYFFEAPIDMLSFISMNKWNWQLNSYAAACSVSDKALLQCLKDNPKIKTVYLCLDNDEAGKKANKRIAEKLKEMNINYRILVPTHKDWNEDLLCEGDEDLCQDFKL
jgi:hypothetical protein